tara:strand:- start:631 stop:1137 length:507 start_codon:yes stop_codon:yes gene_type:complete
MYINQEILDNIYENMYKNKYPIFDLLGFFGPVIVLFINIYFLWNQKLYLYSYIILSFFNTFINKALKIIIQEPRPDKSTSFIGEKYDNTENFGMPSGHAQTIFFSLTYLYMVKQNMYVLLISFFLACLTLFQRDKYKNHSKIQLFVGSIVGICVGYFSVLTVQYFIKK